MTLYRCLAEMYNRADFNRLYDFLIVIVIVIVRK